MPKLLRRRVLWLVILLSAIAVNSFLIKQSRIAIPLALKLTSPQALQSKALSSVAFGLTESQQVPLPGNRARVFSELPFVQPELQDLQRAIRSTLIKLNISLPKAQFQATLATSRVPIVHLATHRQFNSDRDQTFLLDSEGVINIDELETALSVGNTTCGTPIALPLLSACETVSGVDRAPLGLAGIALKSGARRTLASVWKVNDNATLMQRFYQELATCQVAKAAVLQRAHPAILSDSVYRRHPYFGAPFILVGNGL